MKKLQLWEINGSSENATVTLLLETTDRDFKYNYKPVSAVAILICEIWEEENMVERYRLIRPRSVFTSTHQSKTYWFPEMTVEMQSS